tara:strand:- start:2214 stop:2525 length:312 start_codon:yes stop_codon:yes gene_type:complete
MAYSHPLTEDIENVSRYVKEIDMAETAILFYRIQTRFALEELLLEEGVDLVEHRRLINRLATHSIPSLSLQELDNLWYLAQDKKPCGDAISSNDNFINPIAAT